MEIQWYPGHMTKARRQMQEDMKLIDLCIELLDARVPMSSRNPDIDTLAKGKYRLVILNKSDLASEAMTKAWSEYFKSLGIRALSVDSRQRGVVKMIQDAVTEVCKEKLERDRKRGIINRPVRAMVVGIPNVGKSTFINTLAGRAAAKTGNKPGVTKGNQWIRLNRQVELLDTPGILWPKFDDETVGTHLAFIGSINDNILDRHELSLELISYLTKEMPQCLEERYTGLSLENTPEEILQNIAVIKSCLKKGGEADTERAAGMLIEDFRTGRLGKITLEMPQYE